MSPHARLVELAGAVYGDDGWCSTVNTTPGEGRFCTLWHPRPGSPSFTGVGTTTHDAVRDCCAAIWHHLQGRRVFAGTVQT